MNSEPIVKDLVLVGGGHSHVLLLRMLGMKPVPGLRVTLISPDVLTPYSGMLPGVVAGHYSEQDIHIDLVPLCRFAGAEFICSRVENFDPYAKRINIVGRPDIEYDVLSLDIGITPELSVPGADTFTIPVKPIGQFLEKWRAFCDVSGNVSSIAVVGAGAGGVELTLAIAEALKNQNLLIQLVAGSDEILPGYPTEIQARFMAQLNNRNIKVHLGARVSEVTETGLKNSFGGEIKADKVFWVTSAASQSWLSKTGIELDENGFVRIRPTLQSNNFDSVFAVGDIAQSDVEPRPKAGVFAVRQAPILYKNILRFLTNKKPRAYKPQRSFLSLISTGDRNAVASKGPFKAEGKWVWQWKNWIDRKFMQQFFDLPKMKAPNRTGLLAGLDEQMRCGGCGSKVSAGLLSEVLRNSGIDTQDLDDAATYETTANQLMLHTVDTFKSFGADAYTLARIAVHHSLSDIYAMGGQPVTALAMITVPYGTPAKVRSTLEQLVAGSVAALKEEHVKLIGGHTTEGAELSIGFAVNGIGDKETLMTKAGLKAGQSLILTKPLGTGVVLAADMQHLARGEWVQGAYRVMDRSNRKAAEVFSKHEVTSCTDITGFGLAGHLLEMLRASNYGATLHIDKLPLLNGAADCIKELGIRSTLHAGNEAACIEMAPVKHPMLPILFDPQTSGGLLAAVPSDQCDLIISELADAGCVDATCIGEVIDSPNPKLLFDK